ncbi:putative Secreted trypsin-like serine protease [Vibrio nigripulchritudo SOn1]|uniref:Secreted trypsin-like serine protease n=1 Tax=Vibrio nigripulchritudo SOn1 TaxID=1238450 RepID=A0AAV2VKX3_9VIBR|nr:serine protease [Vibrio nigripulchritudo]CCO45326.1 putative Secreted trypsin-like serine protease [Vibrio nigripulchritudo SOn1]
MKIGMSVLALSLISAFGVSATETKQLDQHSVDAKIINGNKAAVDAWPFMTAIVTKGKDAFNGQFCGGSFIGGRYVLTAAHCVEDTNPEDLDVVIGIHDLKKEDSQGQRVAVKNIYSHDQFDTSNLNNDIAVIELEKSVSATSVSLNSSVNALNEGAQVTVMGWGNQQSNPNMGAIFPNELYEVSLPIVSKQTCQASGGQYRYIDDSTLCAGYSYGYQDSCQGDSGGPLIFNNNGVITQVGVVSWGEGCAQRNKYGVYANVANLKDWVEKQTSGISYRQNVYYGYVSVNRKRTQILTLTNYGSSAFEVSRAVVSDASKLRIVSNQCESAGTLYSNQSCNITVEVTSSQGANNATLTAYTTSSTHPTLSTKFHSYGLVSADSQVTSTVGISGSAYSNANPWEVSYNDELKAGYTPSGQRSILLLDGLKPGKISFEARMYIDDRNNSFQIYLNGKSLGKGSEFELDFYKYEFDLTASSNDVALVYERNDTQFFTSDTVYVRNIKHESSSNSNSESSGSSGGSFPVWFLLAFLPLAMLRRR